MKNKGDSIEHLKNHYRTIKKSYLGRLISRILSITFSLILVLLIILGALMFYFNMKVKSFEKRGLVYTPPFGIYTIVSGSMMPEINVYDVVVAVNSKNPEDIEVGDIITYVSSWDLNYGLNITHRVVKRTKNEQGEYSYITKGDNNQNNDGAPVPYSNVIGKVVLRIPQLGRLQFILSTKAGWFFAIFIPALAVVIYDVLQLLKLAGLKTNILKVEDENKVVFKNKVIREKLNIRRSNQGENKLDSTSSNKEVKRKPIVRRWLYE